MNQSTYLNRITVKVFMEWMEERMDAPGSFQHAYVLKKKQKPWSCGCLFDAYRKYY